mmetsp:Transcript_54957/g.130475  ORF Transcript_54957/g.130475 Transcript_54957/m.130475 type:complete len:424 (+) Transcript_54957:198-1469(+)
MTCSVIDKTSPSPSGPLPAEMDDVAAHTKCEDPTTPSNPGAPEDLRTKLKCGAQIYDLGSGYEVKKLIGQGAFGSVVAGERDGRPVAIKKVCNAGGDKTAAKRLLREIRFLRHLRGHPNVISVEDVVVRWHKSTMDVYIVTELMEADLEQIIKSSQALSNEHVRCLIFQLMNGIRHLHHAGVVHRDLKPANCVVDSQCRLKVCDLGLSRHVTDAALVPEGEDARFTDYVVTRWYRAPELLLGNKIYSDAIDVWSVGCVMAELMGRKPLFQGKDYVEMLKLICATIGNPTRPECKHISDKAIKYLEDRTMFPAAKRINWATMFPKSSPQALNLLDSLLQFSPERRLTAEQALAHPYMTELHDVDDEPSSEGLFDFDFEKQKLSLAELRQQVVDESNIFANANRAAAVEAGFDPDEYNGAPARST